MEKVYNCGCPASTGHRDFCSKNKVTLQKVPILMISDVMRQIQNTPAIFMVWHKSHIMSPTLPSSFMTF